MKSVNFDLLPFSYGHKKQPSSTSKTPRYAPIHHGYHAANAPAINSPSISYHYLMFYAPPLRILLIDF